MTYIIWGVSIVMTVNVKVAQATHEAPFSPGGRRVGEEGETVMTFMVTIQGVSAVMIVKALERARMQILR
jgi:hypothetical protein